MCDINRSLYNFSAFFAAVPPYDSRTGKIKHGKFYAWYSISVIGSFAVGSFSSIWNKIANVPPHIKKTEILITVCFFLCMTCLQLVTAVISFRRNQWTRFLRKLAKIDVELRSKKKKIPRWILMYTIVMLCIYLLNVGVWAMALGTESLFYFLFPRIQTMAIHVYVMLLCNIVCYLRDKYYLLNESLKGVRYRCRNVAILKELSVRKNGELEECLRLTLLYTYLNEIVFLFNTLFGWPLYCLMAMTFLMLLDICNTFILGNIDSLNISLIICMFTIVWLWGACVIYFCNGAMREGKRTSVICHKILLEVAQDSPQKEVLERLLEYSTHHIPVITAANIFNIDISTLFSMFGSIITYLIVLIQFKYSEYDY